MLWDVTGGPGLEKSVCKRRLKLWDYIWSVCAQAEEKIVQVQRTILGSISFSESSREKEVLQKREGTNQEQVIIISELTCRSSRDKKLHIFYGTD